MNTVQDELALNKLMARYVDAANTRNGDTWARTWSEDGCWKLMGLEIKGRDKILELWQQVVAGFEFAILMPASGSVDINGENATGIWYLQEFTRDLAGETTSAMARYRDSYKKVDGQWLFETRQYDFIYRGPADLSGDYTPLP